MDTKLKIEIFDTTLRDGEQMPGVVIKPEYKLKISEKLADFGVNCIELMPSMSKTEKETTKKLARENARITACSKLGKKDIDVVADCDVKRLVLIAPMSDIHLEHMLKTDKAGILNKINESIDYGIERGLKIDIAGSDASRAEYNFLADFSDSISNRIDTFIYCDTIGCLTPNQTYDAIKKLKKNVNFKIGIHAHNDFGLATANTLAALEAGADSFSGSFTGIGERAGNVALEEVILSLKYLYNIGLDVKYGIITDLCRTIEKYSGVGLQKHKPIIGKNAFTHESGLHVAGIMKNPETFEIYNPREIGRNRRLVFGKKSGRNGIRYVLEKHGKKCSDRQIQNTLEYIKHLSETQCKAFSESEVVDIHERRC